MDRFTGEGQRVAFFGGSFDPPHLGHLAVARTAREALRLDRVLFTPVGAQPLKPTGSTASYADRLRMTELAISGEPGFEISLADAPRAGKPNYSLDTLSALRAELGTEGQLFFLMGADSFFGLRRWHRSAEIPFAASLIVASRPGEPLVDVAAALPEGLSLEDAPDFEFPSGAGMVQRYLLHNRSGAAASFYLLPGLHVDISATQIREQIQSGENRQKNFFNSLPHAVVDYIRSHGLYRSLAPTPTRD